MSRGKRRRSRASRTTGKDRPEPPCPIPSDRDTPRSIIENAPCPHPQTLRLSPKVCSTTSSSIWSRRSSSKWPARPRSAPGLGVGLVQGSFASLSREIHSLRRRRLGSAALFLAAVFAVLFLWSLFGNTTDHWLVTLMMFLRFAIAAACAGVIVSRISLDARPGSVDRVRPLRQLHDYPHRDSIQGES